MTATVIQFYTKLYTSIENNINLEELHKFIGSETEIPTHSEDQKSQCEGFLTIKEVLDTLETTQNNKTPGLDGFPSEFYKVFWIDLHTCTYLVKALNDSYEEEILPLTMRQGLITLLPKKGKDIQKITKWRPISLLNQDYKLATKCIALRIKKVLNDIIHSDQTGFLPNRYIGEKL